MAFLTINRGGVLEQRVTLDKDVIRIGRLDDNDVALKDGSISRHHARIERQGDRFVIKDLGSQNGIWSGGSRVPELELAPGTAFVMGVFSGLVEAPPVESPPPQAGAYTWAKLFVLEGPVAQPEFSLNRPELRFGRSAGLEVPIDDDLVSKNHAKIVYQNNQHTVLDTGSRNGVFVNGLRVESQVLKHRDEIQIGPARFAFSETGEYIPPQQVLISSAPHPGMAAPAAPAFSPPPARSASAKQKSLFSRVPKIVWFGGLLAVLILIILMAVLSGPPKTEGPSSKEVSVENQQTIQKLLLEGKQFLAGGDYQSALDKANAVLTPDLDPKNREALELQAKAQDKLRELAAAREKAQQEAAERAAKVQALLTDAAAASKNGDFTAAKSLLEDARTVDPNNPNVKKALVDTLIASAQADSKKHDYKGAFEAYDAALQVDPMSAEATKGRESLASFEQAAKSREARTRTLFERAKSEAASGALAKAYQDINAVLSMNSGYPQAANLRGQIQSQLEAKVKPLYDEGVRLFNAGQLVEAANKLSQALAIYPDHQPTQQFLVQARSKLRAEAQEAFRRGYINEGLGRYKEAMDLYQRALNLLPDPNEEYHKKAAEKIAQLKDKVK
jgi:pSer/pThr/pTyr-binding forkhead associated (FHA) protein/tetratricopeptide (TPR) repeat protein